MRHDLVTSAALHWRQLSSWIRAWDPLLEDDDLDLWACGLAQATADLDADVVWNPHTGIVAVPDAVPLAHAELVLRRAIARYAGIDDE
ncbi:hypothetical protein P9990_26880 (plasmid) [Prescottella equi]|uniref:hypothetical protein n=1 Tax=Rhodococcus hoagii TaxID=43767 RepID=UPI00257671B8|nr:hypothetical protein [Prescottella equi]WJJ14437.1 hypothetical protein P9990_26880 [Prescottella equi]